MAELKLLKQKEHHESPEQQKHHKGHEAEHHHHHKSDLRHTALEREIVEAQRVNLVRQNVNAFFNRLRLRNRNPNAPGEEHEEDSVLAISGGLLPKSKDRTAKKAELDPAFKREREAAEHQSRDLSRARENQPTVEKTNINLTDTATAKEDISLENRTQRDAASMADPTAEQEVEISLDHVVSEENPMVAQLHLFRQRNRGAKDFDDFARGIQTWLSTLELEAMKRFHSIHMDPIVDAMEEYVLRLAEGLVDLILKALLLSRLKICQRAAMEVAKLAWQMIEKLVKERDEDIPLDKLFTYKQLEKMKQAKLNADSGF
jgi:hypothetical protein